jgi:type I restriction enzyme R subunit
MSTTPAPINIEEFLHRLSALNEDLSEEEQRAVREDLSEAELAILELLTKPEPELTNAERLQVRGAAKKLLEAVTDRLVLEWRESNMTKASVRQTIGRTLDAELPDAYDPDLFQRKVDSVFDHVYKSYDNADHSVYVEYEQRETPADTATAPVGSVDDLTEQAMRRAERDPEFFAQLMQQLFGAQATWSMSVEQLFAGSNDEGRVVEYKQTARWNVREQRKDKTMEDVIAKTVAGFLNAEGGTLLIGVDDDGNPVGLEPDYALVKPSNRDGYVNWLDTMLQNALGHVGARRVRIRLELVDGYEVCRVDVPASSRPIWATKGQDRLLFERRNNSTRAVPADELEVFLTERFGLDHVGDGGAFGLAPPPEY